MSDKRNDFIEGNDFALYGEKIIVSPLNQSNVRNYLATYKSASAFSKVYEMMLDFWKTQRKWIEDYAAGEKGANWIYRQNAALVIMETLLLALQILNAGGRAMLADEIKAGEPANIEFKIEVPKRSEKYIKSVITFANTAGGKIIIGVDDESHEIVGVDKDDVFKIMDSITNTISDMCYPQIFPNIGVDTVEGKCVIVIEIYPGANRPYYMKSLGKAAGTFIRVSGTSRPADVAILKDLELQGANHSFDEMVRVDQKFDIKQAEELCAAIKNIWSKRQKPKVKRRK